MAWQEQLTGDSPIYSCARSGRGRQWTMFGGFTADDAHLLLFYRWDQRIDLDTLANYLDITPSAATAGGKLSPVSSSGGRGIEGIVADPLDQQISATGEQLRLDAGRNFQQSSVRISSADEHQTDGKTLDGKRQRDGRTVKQIGNARITKYESIGVMERGVVL